MSSISASSRSGVEKSACETKFGPDPRSDRVGCEDMWIKSWNSPVPQIPFSFYCQFIQQLPRDKRGRIMERSQIENVPYQSGDIHAVDHSLAVFSRIYYKNTILHLPKQ
jgi:hypothetical protein